MPFTTWIRDALGIRKDVIDTKKSKLELERLEDEKRARNLITPATLDDVEKYDPKVHRLQKKLERIRWLVLLVAGAFLLLLVVRHREAAHQVERATREVLERLARWIK